MKLLHVGIILASSAAASAPSLAKGPAQTARPAAARPQPPAPQDLIVLRRGLEALAQTALGAPTQAGRPSDPDQGDEHANPRALEIVCNKTTPAARRSAICPPVSPD